MKKNLSNLEVTQVKMQACPGRELNQCIKEALIYAIEDEVIVELTHNASKFYFNGPVLVSLALKGKLEK